MNFALLGSDPAVLPLIEAIARHSEHALSHAALLGGIQAEIAQSGPGVRVVRHWDELLSAEDLDAIIVAGHAESVLEGARQLATHGRPLLIVPDVRQELDWIYHLTLVRDDTRVLLAPLIPSRVEPTVRRARELIDAGALGTLLHLQFEREQPPGREPAGPPLLTRDEVHRELLRDVDLLRALGGDYDQVTAVHSGTVGEQLTLATVTLAGRNLPEATWTVRAVLSPPRWSLKLSGVKGGLELVADGSQGPQLLLDGAPEQITADAVDPGDALLEWVERTLAGERPRPDWTDLTRAFEIVDAARRSVARRRTIDLHFETASERSLFKTQMTALGCGVLVVTALAVMLLLLAGAIFNIGDQAMRIARVLVFVPLFLFLVLQVLLYITRPSIAKQQPGRDEERQRE